MDVLHPILIAQIADYRVKRAAVEIQRQNYMLDDVFEQLERRAVDGDRSDFIFVGILILEKFFGS